MTLKTVPAPIAALLAASVLLAGCADDSSGDAGGERSTDAPTSASTSDGASGDDASDGDGSTGSGELTTATFNEEIIRAQQEAGSYRSTATTSTAGMSLVLESEATYEGGKAYVHGRTTSDSPQQIETIAADGVVYLKAASLGTPAGKWVKIDPDDPANANNPLASIAATSDPETALRAMGDLESLELVGSEKVDGVDTDHYRAVMTTENYATVLGLPDEAAAALPATIPFDMWVDEDNRPIRYEIELSVQGITSKTSQTYRDYGADIEVTVPKDSETVPLSESGLG